MLSSFYMADQLKLFWLTESQICCHIIAPSDQGLHNLSIATKKC